MAPRRSARIQTQHVAVASSALASDVKKTPIVKSVAGQKRKAPAARVAKATANKRSATEAAVSKTKTRAKSPPPAAQSCSNGGGLSSMPPEILNMILDNVSALNYQLQCLVGNADEPRARSPPTIAHPSAVDMLISY